MRTTLVLSSLLLAAAACGDDGHDVTPTLIPGGGVRDPGIDGELNVYVIDADTDQPIAGAAVLVGGKEGVTDSAGLYVAAGGDVQGPLTAAVKATGYASAVWVGLDSANLTVPLERSTTTTPVPAQAELAGTITGWDALPTPAANHLTLALVTYSQRRDIGATDNNLPPPVVAGPIAANVCVKTPQATPACAWRINARTGKVQVYALIVDLDGRGTPEETDDVVTVTGFAVGTAVDVVADADQSGLALAVLPTGSTTTAQVAFGTPPGGLPEVAGIVGVDVGDAGVMRIGQVATTANSVVMPSLSAIPGSTYELLGVAQEAAGATPPAQSIVLRRKLASASAISAGDWLAPATGLASDRTSVSFGAVAGASVHTIELDTSVATTPRRAMSVVILDDSETVTLPVAFAPLPAGALDVRVQALDAGADFDGRVFEIDDLDDVLVRISADTIRLN